jgi:hypothetical protein
VRMNGQAKMGEMNLCHEQREILLFRRFVFEAIAVLPAIDDVDWKCQANISL